MDDLERFLGLVCRELGSDDAHFELGGREPSEPDRVAAEISGGWRIVARFFAASGVDVAKEREKLVTKLEALVASFSGVSETLEVRSPALHAPSAAATASRELDEALALLADKGEALRAVVIDEDSPVLWGSSEDPRGPEDVEVAMWIGGLADSAASVGLDMVELVQLDDEALAARLAELEPRKLRERLLRKLPVIRELAPQRDRDQWAAHFATCRAIAAVRRAPENHEQIDDDLGWLARDFGGIYHVILVYGGRFSEIGAAGVMLRALPAIEKLVLSLPPIDPAPKGARILAFRRR